MIGTHRRNLGDLRKDDELEGIMWPSRFSIKLIVFADLEIRLVGNNGYSRYFDTLDLNFDVFLYVATTW